VGHSKHGRIKKFAKNFGWEVLVNNHFGDMLEDIVLILKSALNTHTHTHTHVCVCDYQAFIG